jgi:hypothetical protein
MSCRRMAGKVRRDEIDKPAILFHRLHVVPLVTSRSFSADVEDVEIDTAIVVVFEVFHLAVEADAADFCSAAVVSPAGILAV